MIIDTSVFIAAYDERDPKRLDALEIIKRAEQSKIFISDYIINETATVALRKIGLEKAGKIINTLINNEKIIVGYTTEKDFNEILDIFKNQSDKLSFVDCSIVWMSRTLGLEVASFDKNLLDELKAAK